MNENTKVTLVSTTDNLSISIPSAQFKKDFAKRNTRISIERSMFDQIMLDPGVEYMINTGLIYIEDMKLKQEIGLEPEDASEPVNIIVLNDTQKKRYLTAMPLSEFKTAVAKLSKEQQIDLAQYAIDNELSNLDKDTVLREATDINIRRAIELNRQAKEDPAN